MLPAESHNQPVFKSSHTYTHGEKSQAMVSTQCIELLFAEARSLPQFAAVLKSCRDQITNESSLYKLMLQVQGAVQLPEWQNSHLYKYLEVCASHQLDQVISTSRASEMKSSSFVQAPSQMSLYVVTEMHSFRMPPEAYQELVERAVIAAETVFAHPGFSDFVAKLSDAPSRWSLSYAAMEKEFAKYLVSPVLKLKEELSGILYKLAILDAAEPQAGEPSVITGIGGLLQTAQIQALRSFSLAYCMRLINNGVPSELMNGALDTSAKVRFLPYKIASFIEQERTASPMFKAIGTEIMVHMDRVLTSLVVLRDSAQDCHRVLGLTYFMDDSVVPHEASASSPIPLENYFRGMNLLVFQCLPGEDSRVVLLQEDGTAGEMYLSIGSVFENQLVPLEEVACLPSGEFLLSSFSQAVPFDSHDAVFFEGRLKYTLSKYYQHLLAAGVSVTQQFAPHLFTDTFAGKMRVTFHEGKLLLAPPDEIFDSVIESFDGAARILPDNEVPAPVREFLAAQIGKNFRCILVELPETDVAPVESVIAADSSVEKEITFFGAFGHSMEFREFQRVLTSLGVTSEWGKGSHLKLMFNNQTYPIGKRNWDEVVPIRPAMARQVLKGLGIPPEDFIERL